MSDAPLTEMRSLADYFRDKLGMGERFVAFMDVATYRIVASSAEAKQYGINPDSIITTFEGIELFVMEQTNDGYPKLPIHKIALHPESSHIRDEMQIYGKRVLKLPSP